MVQIINQLLSINLVDFLMAHSNRTLTSNLRHSSMGGSQASSSQSPMLVARINEKRAELEGLKQLQELSAELAMQMQTMEEKLSTLSDGTEGSTVPQCRVSLADMPNLAVAAVLSNWHNVMRAINMASGMYPLSLACV